MSRRRLVALISASVILGCAMLIVVAFLGITRTDPGREQIRKFINQRLASSFRGRGSMYIGHISGNLLGELMIDSVAIRDGDDSLFVATGPLHVRYDFRDLFDRRILLSYMEVTRPFVNMRKHADQVWAYKRIFPQGPKKPPSLTRQVTRQLGFGDFIVIDSAVIRDLTFVLTQPWQPDSWLKGAQRDSATRHALADSAHEVRHSAEGLVKTLRWTHLDLQSPYMRIAHPDTAGRYLILGRLDLDESDPPFRFRNAHGDVRILGDSVWLSLAHFDLPASTGSARGKLWWNSTDPLHYDVHAVADSISLSDVAWIYPTLPRTGGGRTDLTIRNDPKDLHVLDYALTNFDMRSVNSHLRGAMTFGVGAPVLQVKDVNLVADPLDFDLLRTFAGGTFPVDWRGQFFGTLKGPGGPLDRWQVSDAKLTFHDAHVRGATMDVQLKGGLNILQPADAKFRGTSVTLGRLDLRSIEYLFPSFPRLRGIVTGSAVLDSIWTDVRFHDLDITHIDGAGPRSRLTGSGRLTNGKTLVYDVDLVAQPVSFTTLGFSYPHMGLRGEYTGPLRMVGPLGDLQLATTLTGQGGTLKIDGHFDLDSVGGLAARGTLTTTNLNAAALLKREIPPTDLTGVLTADVRGDTLADLEGTATIDLAPSRVDRYAADTGSARLAFANQRVRIDTATIVSHAMRMSGSGALGLSAVAPDSLHYQITVDSISALRAYLRPEEAWVPPQVENAGDSALPLTASQKEAELQADSLVGSLHAEGIVFGTLDTMTVRGTALGDEVRLGVDGAAQLRAQYDLEGLPSAPQGTVSAELDSVTYSVAHFDSVKALITVHDRDRAQLALQTFTLRGDDTAQAGLSMAAQRSADSLRLVLDTLGGIVGIHQWRMVHPTTIVSSSDGLSLDSLSIVGDRGGHFAVRGELPVSRPIDLAIALDSFALADIGSLIKTRDTVSGRATLELKITGNRRDPVIAGTGSIDDLRYGSLNLPDVTLSTDYARRRLRLGGTAYRDSTPVLTASGTFPVDLAFEPVRQRYLSDTLRGRIAADSVDLALLQSFTSMVTDVKGSLSTDVRIRGTWDHPYLVGPFTIANGEMTLPRIGIRLRGFKGDVAFVPDSLLLRDVSASSGPDPLSKMSLKGSIATKNVADLYADWTGISIDLRSEAARFQAYQKVEISESLQLSGPFDGLVLNGTLSVDRGTISIPSLAQREVVDLDSLGTIVDTTSLAVNTSIWTQYPALKRARDNLHVPDLSVTIGDEVWLRSQEANIKLGGSVVFNEEKGQRFAGTIRVERGTYRLDFGLLQRTFQVDSGTVTFYNDPNASGELNIYASYIVRQANALAQDVKVIAHITGTAKTPRLALSSDERYPLSYSEILSYLIFGQPTLGNPGEQNASFNSVAAALLPTVGSVLERAISQEISFFDYVQVQTGGYSNYYGYGATNNSFATALANSRIAFGKQVNDRVFVVANAGLCQLTGTSNTSFFDAFGMSIDYRIAANLSAQVTREPSTAALQCKPGAPTIGTRPVQYGFDLFREWAF